MKKFATEQEIKDNENELISYQEIRHTILELMCGRISIKNHNLLQSALNVIDLAAIVANNDGDTEAERGIYYHLS
jgi:hypothetical protein